MAGKIGDIDLPKLDPNIFPFDLFIFDPTNYSITLKAPWVLSQTHFNVIPWSSVTTYVQYDVVFYNDALWVCKTTSTNNVPPNVTYWYGLRTYGA